MSTIPCLFIVAFISAMAICATSAELAARQYCASNYSPCHPSGATSTTSPHAASDISSLYVDLLASISEVHKKKRELPMELLPRGQSGSPSFCCIDGTKCLLLQEHHIPFCYDRFTTNYFLPDGSYGSITTGAYNVSDGSSANLLTGDFISKDGSTSNLYTGALHSAKPDPATLTLPTPYTSSGIGSAIAVTALGGLQTYVTTLDSTVTGPTTVSARTISPTRLAGGSEASASTVDPKTISGTSVLHVTTTVTTSVTGGGAAASATATKRSGGRSATSVDGIALGSAMLWAALVTLFDL